MNEEKCFKTGVSLRLYRWSQDQRTSYLAPDKKILSELLEKRSNRPALEIYEELKLINHNNHFVFGYCKDMDEVHDFMTAIQKMTEFPYREEYVGIEDLKPLG